MTAAVSPRGTTPVWPLPALAALFAASLVLALFLGVVDLPASDILATLAGKGSPEARSIILDIRLPRIVTGMLVGVHFALAGLLLQNITRNPLADPSIMGVSQGATLSVTLFLLFAVFIHDPGSTARITQVPLEWLPAIGAAGGIAAGALVFTLSARVGLSPLRVTLVGIAVGAVLQALAVGLIAGWGSAQVEILLEWLSGSLYARTWSHAAFLLPFTVAGLVLLAAMRRSLDVLRFDASVARSFGLSYGPQFALALFLCCGLAASAVGVAGPIVFVGLVVPHLARLAAGRRPALVLPLTVTLGALAVTLADLVGRLAGGAEEIPIGVVTALCGVPVLVVLLRRLP